MYKSKGLATSLLVFYSFVLLPAPAWAEDTLAQRGHILKISGDVSVVNARGERRRVEESRFLVREMDTIITRKGGKAVVQFNDGALSVLDEKSSLRVEKTSWFSHIGGKIYFTFRKVFGPERKVQSKFATIGVRGTTFIVYDNEQGEGVALQEGNLEIESPGPEFEIHRRKVVDEFEAFKQQQKEQREALQKEFDDYKNDIQKEFVEYKKSFTLKGNHMIRFDGNRVDETELDENTRAEFESFEQEAGDMLKAFREQVQEQREVRDEE